MLLQCLLNGCSDAPDFRLSWDIWCLIRAVHCFYDIAACDIWRCELEIGCLSWRFGHRVQVPLRCCVLPCLGRYLCPITTPLSRQDHLTKVITLVYGLAAFVDIANLGSRGVLVPSRYGCNFIGCFLGFAPGDEVRFAHSAEPMHNRLGSPRP